MRKISDTLVVLLIATLFLSFTAWMGVQTYRSGADFYERIWSSPHWTTVQGNIVDVQAYRGCGKGGRGYSLDVQYTYQIGTTTYTNDRMYFGSSSCHSKAVHEQRKTQFPIGGIVPVYVDPDQAMNAVLNREHGRFSPLFGLLIGLTLLFATLIPIRFALRAWKDNQHQTQRLADVLLRRSEIDRSIRVSAKS